MTRSSRWRKTARTGRAFARALLLSIVLGTAFGGGAAMAGSDAFCNNCSVGGNVQWPGPNHSLTASRGTMLTAGYSGCGGAVGYGSYFCGDPAGCHTYSGVNVLTPGIRHRSSTSKTMDGYSTWGSTAPPSNCSWVSVYSAPGPVTAAAANPEGIPVLDREVATAPADVAELVPGADLKAARRFSTPKGDAWVLVDAGQRQVCLVVDDEGTGYGYSCQRFGDIRSAGTLATLEDDDVTTGKGDVVIALAPQGVDELEVTRRDGTKRRVAVSAGVAVTTLTAKDDEVALSVSEDAPKGVKARRFSAAS